VLTLRLAFEQIDGRGGLAVLISTIPASLREWVQWKGRTARNDHKGQYGVILNSTSKLIRSTMQENGQSSLLQSYKLHEASGWPACSYDSALVDSLLAIGDNIIRDKLQAIQVETQQGIAMNRICEVFYSQRTNDESIIIDSSWPCNEKQRKLRDYLESPDRGEEATNQIIDDLEIRGLM
jgi:hypothetical protein